MAFLDETGLAELWSLIKAADAKAAKIATGSYTGTGKSGASNPNTLTFSFTPKLVFLHSGDGAFAYGNNYSGGTVPGTELFIWGTGQTKYTCSTNSNLVFTQSGKNLSWYHEDQYSVSAFSQCNASGKTYHYIAIG